MLQNHCQVHNFPTRKDKWIPSSCPKMSLSTLMSLLPPLPKISNSKLANHSTPQPLQIPTSTIKNSLLPNLVSLAIALTLTSPLPSLAIPSFNSKAPPVSPTTPFSQSKNLLFGLEDGKIRPCPPTNPGCISTNPKSSSSVFPLVIPDNTQNVVQKLQEAILETQKNAKIDVIEDTPSGQYVQAEVDGSFGRDVMEFLVKGDVVAYRSMAKKVTYVYPFTTAIGDSKGQEERMQKIIEALGWYPPSFETMD